MRGLYAIVDADLLEASGVDLAGFAERVIAARPAVVQLRAKRAGARDVLEWLRTLRALCDAAAVLLFANDRPDLAVLARCDGVHVGQTDLRVSDVRRFAPHLRVGVSTHDEAQLGEALAFRPDYVAYGPVFPTRTKRDPDPVVGLAGLARASQQCRLAGVPLVAIGGIDLARAADVSAHAELGAVISGLMPRAGDPDPKAQAVLLHRALGGV
jgi:thiamine-phosphate pyrophosphorylase